MTTIRDKKINTDIFRPSVNILRDAKDPFNYTVTPNALQVYEQLVNSYKLGTRAFTITGAYGTGKSAFLLAFEKTINKQLLYFSEKPFNGIQGFEIINVIGEHSSMMDFFAEYFQINKKNLRGRDITAAIQRYYHELRKKDKGLMIVVDEFGKYLEYAAENNPGAELYFIQQLSELVSDPSTEMMLVTTLHKDFSDYSLGLAKGQQQEWDKVRGRLKEITFNEPVEQLLLLASERIGKLHAEKKDANFKKLFSTIGKSKAFPLRDYFSEEIAQKLLPFDILSAACLTLALQRYGQNERSLFSFIHSADPLSLLNYIKKDNPYYNTVCVYDYIVHNFHSLISTRYNPDYAQWAGIRSAIERVETTVETRIDDAVKVVKVIGMLNLFGSSSARINIEFLKGYCAFAVGLKDVEKVIKELEGLRIVRFVRHQDKFKIFEGTDLDIEMAINKAGDLVEKVKSVVGHLNTYFDFPYLSAKAIHYELGVPRYFAFKLSEKPIKDKPVGEIDGYINLVFSEEMREEDIIAASKESKDALLFGWYKNTGEIRNLLFEIDKIKKVCERNSEDKVAIRELDSILQHQVRLLNHYVTGSLYKQGPNLNWYYKGRQRRISDQRSFNQLLSEICRQVYPKTPAYKNEMVNKTKLSSPIQAAKKIFIRSLIENWDKKDLGFEEKKFPPEKTIYLSLLRDSGIHRMEKNAFVLGAPTKREVKLNDLWESCCEFLESTYNGRRNLAELVDELLTSPFKLKAGFIEFWLPVFLFAKKDDFALFGKKQGYIPFLTPETIELLVKDPQDYEIKAFNIGGVRLNLFNSYRTLLNLSVQKNPTNKAFVDTIIPFLNFYRKLPEYTRNTKNMDQRTLALRTAVSTAIDPEDSFFVQFPKAIGYNITELSRNSKLLKEYIDTLQESIKEIRTCYDELVSRVEAFILNDITGKKGKFPAYRTYLQGRYKNLKEYLLLPHQRSFYQRLYTEVEDKTAWLNSITHACLGKPLEIINDAEEYILYDKLRDIFHELDNLTEISESGFDIQQEIAFKFEITSFVEGLKKNLVRLPKNKSKQLLQLQSVVKAKLSDDKQLNIATLAKMLEELLDHES
jgi:hypothetical protein